MNELLTKLDFGNEAGDDVHPEELFPYFVEQKRFKPFLNFNNKLIIATAKKGIGKSALIQWIAYKVQQKIRDRR